MTIGPPLTLSTRLRSRVQVALALLRDRQEWFYS